MLPASSKPSTRSQKAPPSPSYAQAFAAGKKFAPPRLGGQSATGGVLTSNMGNIMAGHAAAPQPTNVSKSTAPGFRSRFGIAGLAKNKLGLGAQSTAAPLQLRGNPTGGGRGALASVGAPAPAQGRGFLTVANQALGSGLLQPQKPNAAAAQKFIARPAQRFKIRKDAPSGQVNTKTGTGAIAPRRPFAGKTVEEAGPSGAGELLVSVDVPNRAVVTPKTGEACETLDDGLGSLISKTDSIRIRDIDRADDGPQLVPEYVNEITNYLFDIEAEKFRVKPCYLDNTNLSGRMRAILLDWLVQVHQSFGFKQETMFIAVSVLDRFLIADGSVQRTQLQLVGATALLIAVKYEEITVPRLQDFANISDRAFVAQDILAMEIHILKKIGFDLSLPIPSFFLRRCSKAVQADIKVHTVAKFITELAMIDYSSCHIRPSMVAAAALALALMLSHRKPLTALWDPTVAHYSRYSLKDILPFVKILGRVLADAYEADGKLVGVRRKYSGQSMHRISGLPALNPADWKAWLAEELEAAKALAN